MWHFWHEQEGYSLESEGGQKGTPSDPETKNLIVI